MSESEKQPPPRYPEVGEVFRGHGTLIRVIELPPVQPPPILVFEDKTFQVRVMSGTTCIDHICTFNNLHRNTYEDSIERARKEATAPKRNIPQSGFSVVVVEVIGQHERQRLHDGTCRDMYDRRFHRLGKAKDSVVDPLAETRRRVLWASDWPDDKPPLPSTECVWWDNEEPTTKNSRP